MNNLDIKIFHLINDLADSLSFLNPLMIFIAKYTLYILMIMMVVLWFVGKDRIKTRIMLLCAAFSAVTGVVIGKLLGLLYYHEQPFAALDNVNNLIGHKIDNSFPSDHTIVFFAVCMFFFFYYKKPYSVLAVVWASLVGISRIWGGVHYPVDILVGSIVGTTTSLLFFNLVYKKRLLRPIVTSYTKIEDRILRRNS